MNRPLYSRTDLDLLKSFTREPLLDALGSFDERACDAPAFILQTAGLLDPSRVSGLSSAVRDADSEAVCRAVTTACTPTASGLPGDLSDEALRLAEDALVHRFTFYSETHQLPASIDWDFNPGTAHWGHDLNRFSYLSPLVRAYGATQDPRFSRKAIALILDWIAQCDIGRCFTGTPYVFGSYLNNAIHGAAWARCLQALLPAGQVQPEELLRILKSLHDQLAYLEVVTNGHQGNWPTIGVQGILQVLAAFPVFRDTDRWIGYGIQTLASQIDEQILPDGAQDELTPHYHAVVVNNLLSASESLQKLGRALEPGTMKTFEKMVRYQQQTIMPDRRAQLAFNDSDPEAVPEIDARLEALGFAGFLAPQEELGPAVYPYAGVAFLRQPAARGDLYLAFDGGPFGRSHQHEDKLGFWLHAYGRNFIVDPGRHLYDHSAASYYDYLRSTRAHSTFLVDGQGQHSRGRPDTWIATAPVPLTFEIREGEVRAAACYDLGYGPQNAIDVAHHREIVFVRETCWIVFDRLVGAGEHRLESRFQFCPGDLTLDEGRVTTRFADANLLVWSLGEWDDVHLESGQENPRGGWYSASYSLLEPAPALSLSATAALPFSSATLLLPYRGKSAPAVGFAFDGVTATLHLQDLGELSIPTSLVA